MTTEQKITALQDLARELHLGPVTVMPGEFSWGVTLPDGRELVGYASEGNDPYQQVRFAMHAEARFRKRFFG